MTRLHSILSSASRAFRASLLLALLLTGAACHFWHHVQDPECDSGREGSGHACVACAGLHGSTLVPHAQPAPAPQSSEWTDAPVAPRIVAAFAPAPGTSPRAPPAA